MNLIGKQFKFKDKKYKIIDYQQFSDKDDLYFAETESDNKLVSFNSKQLLEALKQNKIIIVDDRGETIMDYKIKLLLSMIGERQP